MSSTITRYEAYPINPRVRIAALWTSTLFVFVYVDLFSMFRADIRADIEAGKMFAFSIGQGFLLAVTVYILIPSLMLSLSLLLPAQVARMTNIVVAALYAITIAGGAVGEWNYYILGSVAEVALLGAVVYYAWTWPRVSATIPTARAQRGTDTRVRSTSKA